MFDAATLSGRAACTCPLCGLPLAIALKRSTIEDQRRYEDVAQRAVLDHLLTAHAGVVEHSTVVAIGALIVAGAGTA